MARRYQGRLVEWHDEQGYGFIQGISDPRHDRVFIHIRSFERSGPRPIQGCVLEYQLALDDRARPQAHHVRYVKAQDVQSAPAKPAVKQVHGFHLIYVLMSIYWVSLLVLSYAHLLPNFSLLIILFINSYCYWLFYRDKQAAIDGAARIPEQQLLLLCALGGWTAAWFAAQHFRHKTQKQPFRTYFALSIVLNIVLIAFSVWIIRLYH